MCVHAFIFTWELVCAIDTQYMIGIYRLAIQYMVNAYIAVY